MLLELRDKRKARDPALVAMWGDETEVKGWGGSPQHTPGRCLPSNRDPGIQIVEFGGAQSNLLVLLPICSLNLQLHQLLLDPLHRFLLALHCPGVAKNKALNS